MLIPLYLFPDLPLKAASEVPNRMVLDAIFQILLILLLIVAQARLGQLIAQTIFKSGGNPEECEKSSIYKLAIPLGIAASIAILFFLRCIGLKLSAASLLLLLPLLIRPAELSTTLKLFIPAPSVNFLIWFFVILASGISLFDATGDIQTPWVNNYGDLAFHLGMITNFLWGRDFPPEYHLFAGEQLSYPFFINLWSALLWWPNSTFNSLHLVFVIQWVTLWMIVYRALNGSRYYLLPWVILFGGGSYFYFNVESGKLIGEGHYWTTFLSTIWVTQRTALFGAAISLSALSAFHDREQAAKSPGLWGCNPSLSCAGLLLALAPLIHTHIALVTTLFIGITLALYLKSKEDFQNLLSFSLPFILALTFLPWLLGKEGMLSIYDGWSEPKEHYRFLDLLSLIGAPKFIGNSIAFWLSEAPQVLGIALFVWSISKKHREFIAIVALFFLGNYIKVASWEWDQIKVFLGLYLVLIALIASSNKLQRWYTQLALVLLMIPALIETAAILAAFKKFTIYTKSEIQFAVDLRQATDRNAIIMAAPAHNSPVTLSGRQLYFGFEGTLNSHAINYRGRKQLFDGFDGAIRCRKLAPIQEKDSCPTHLFWTNRETQKWPGRVPVRYPELVRTTKPFLYEVKN